MSNFENSNEMCLSSAFNGSKVLGILPILFNQPTTERMTINWPRSNHHIKLVRTLSINAKGKKMNRAHHLGSKEFNTLKGLFLSLLVIFCFYNIQKLSLLSGKHEVNEESPKL
jgi:hypothetical protein